MIVETKDYKSLWPVFKEHLTDVSAFQWLNEEKNVALTDDHGNFSLFTYELPGIYFGHYFFKDRGNKAKKIGLEMLDYMFDVHAAVIQGLTPVENLGARWMSRQLGFKSQGVVQTVAGPCIHFILTKKDYVNE